MSVTEWINTRFGVDMNDQALTAIKDFSLIWNVFEDRVCENNFSIATVEQRINERDFSAAFFADHLQYFKTVT